MNNTDRSIRILECHLQDRRFFFESSQVDAVMQASSVRADSSRTENFVGTVLHNGQEISVIRLSSVLGFDCQPKSSREHLIILKTKGIDFGLLVDGVSGYREIDSRNISPLPTVVWNSQSSFFDGIVALPNPASGDSATREIEAPTSSKWVEEDDDVLSGLLVAPAGLLGESRFRPTSRWTGHVLDVGKLYARSIGTEEQVIAFDVSQAVPGELRAALAVSISQVLEVMHPTDLLHVPGAPAKVEGIVRWRRQYVPVLDLPRTLGLSDNHFTSGSRIVIARSSRNQLVGFYSAADIRTIRLPIDAEPCDITTTASPTFVHGSYVTSEGILVLPNFDQLVAA